MFASAPLSDSDFAVYQEKRRQELWGLLGDLPPWRTPQAELVRTERHPGYTLEHLLLDLNGVERVPALLLLPDRRPDPAPGLLYLHSHGGDYDMGKEELIRIDNLAGHGIYYYVPSLLKHFQAHEICELIVPRPHLSLNGRLDPLAPAAGVERIRDHLLPLYSRYGQPAACHIELFDCAHQETPAMRKLVLDWLDRYLVAASSGV